MKAKIYAIIAFVIAVLVAMAFGIDALLNYFGGNLLP